MYHVELPAPVAAVVAAINAGDTEAFVRAFTPDGVINDWGRILRGEEGVRSWAQSDAIGANARMTVLDAVIRGDTTELRFGWQSRVFNGESRAFVTVRGDRVSEFRIPSE